MTDQTTALERANQNGIEPQPQKLSGLISRDSSENAMLLDVGKFEHGLRIAKLFASSRLVPDHYHGSIENCFIAISQAIRMRTDVLSYMQNTYVVGGKLAMEGKMAIALINSRGPFKGLLQWEYEGEGDERKCRAWATSEDTGEPVYGTWVTWHMVEAEGWNKSKRGMTSKWMTMPDQMFAYRSAVFFGRQYCPEVIMGMLTKEEAEDLVASGQLAESNDEGQKADDLTARILQAEDAVSDAPKQLEAKKAPEIGGEDFQNARQEREREAVPADSASSQEAQTQPQQETAPQAKSAPQPADAGADVPDVDDLIGKMQIELAQCAECQTQEAAKKCVNGTSRRYFDQAQSLSDADKRRFREAYDEAHADVGQMIKQLPSEGAAASNETPKPEEQAAAVDEDQPDMFAGEQSTTPDDDDALDNDGLGEPTMY